MYIACLIILYFSASVTCHHVDDIDEKFSDVYVEIDQPANLSCVQPKANRLLSCLWERSDSNATKNLNLTYPSEEAKETRATYIGNGVNECAFELKNLNQEDLTSWKATLGWKMDEDHQAYRICKVQLGQKVAPKFVKIQNKDELRNMIDEDGHRNNTVTLKCCADTKAAPPPELTFLFDGQVVQNASYDEEESCLVWSNYTFLRNDSSKHIDCSLKHPLLEEGIKDNMTLNVQYGPVLLDVNEGDFTVMANPAPEISPNTHFKIEKQTEATNVWTITPTLLANEIQNFNISVSNLYKKFSVAFQIPAMRNPKPWTTLKIVLLGLGVVLALIALASLKIFVARKTGFFEPEQLKPKPEYPVEQPPPAMLFQANAIHPEA